MKLSQVLNSDNNHALLYGVNVDCEVLSAPPGIDTIAFTYEPGPYGVSERLMDAIITFTLAGASVIVEIAPQDNVEPDIMMKLAANAGFSIAIIPPNSGDYTSLWANQCASFVPAFLSTPNFSKHIVPVQGYFTYLLANCFGNVPAMTPTDPYILTRFVEPTPQDWSDAAKAAMRDSFYACTGGQAAFNELAQDLVNGIAHETVEIIKRDRLTK